jgi:hypothetical protein
MEKHAKAETVVVWSGYIIAIAGFTVLFVLAIQPWLHK